MAILTEWIQDRVATKGSMKRTLSPRRSALSYLVRQCLVAAFMGAMFFCAGSFGQGLFPEWVRTYSFDAAKTNQPVKCLLVGDGLVVAGSSAGAAGDSDYLVIKYGFDGAEKWVRRYGSAPGTEDSLRAMAIDPAGNIFVTGTSDTVKYDPQGNLV
jgi:hypothetical protein